MNEIKIREDKVSLDSQELKTLTEFEIKSITEDGYAEVKLTLLAKLTWFENSFGKRPEYKNERNKNETKTISV